MTGMVSLAMTADMLWIGKTPTIAVSATGIFARNVLHTAVVAMKPYAWDVQEGARFVKSQFAQIVRAAVQNAVLFAVVRVLKKIYVQTVSKKWRKKMKNKKFKSTEASQTKVKASLKQVQQKSNSPAEEKKAKQEKRLALRFSPTAWAKLLYFRDKMNNEVGGFGITEPDDLLGVQDFITVKQEVTAISVKFDDEAVADFFDAQVDLGRKPEQFARIWLHSHPGDSPEPSVTDEETFARVFGGCQWAVMFVLAQDNRTYAKFSFNVGPGGQVLIPVKVDYSQDFGPSDREVWDAEYRGNIKAATWLSDFDKNDKISAQNDLSSYALPYDFLDEFEKMEPSERQFILDELADRHDLWDEESEVMFL